MDTTTQRTPTLLPKTRQGGSRSIITRCLESACAIAASRPQLPAFLDGFARIEAVLQRVLVAARSA
jgi:hypothetical protein